jgi:uncharacterized protein
VTSDTRYVLDTGVLVSALLLPRSIPRQAVDRAFAEGVVLASAATIDELEDVLRRPKFDRYVQEDDRLQFLAAFISGISLVEVTDVITDCRDVKDNKFLELAVSGQATSIVSGDSDLLVLHPFRGISIVTPHMFLSRP